MPELILTIEVKVAVDLDSFAMAYGHDSVADAEADARAYLPEVVANQVLFNPSTRRTPIAGEAFTIGADDSGAVLVGKLADTFRDSLR